MDTDRYDTDYSELYKGLAVVIGFFLFLVLLLLIFILISYLRKWWRLKKHGSSSADAATPPPLSRMPHLNFNNSKYSGGIIDDGVGVGVGVVGGGKYPKRYSKSGLVQPATPP
ncbi:hypothetical protein TYRP_002643, partial [Tyrophagus putrescentiae]